MEEPGPDTETRARRISVGPSAAVAALVSSVAILIIQQQLNADFGVAYPLFSYGNEVVAADLLGCVIPLVACALLFGYVIIRATNEGRPLPFRSPALWLSMVAISFVSVIVFTLASGIYGGLGIPISWARGTVAVGSTGGAVYGATLGRARNAIESASECYVIGALAMLLGDVIRTFTGLVSGPVVVWGGGGALDLLLWFGAYMATASSCYRIVQPRVQARMARLYRK
ncbi:MAG: hypothetical protein OK455_08215, partial [Thaumarchaeota archaeon]|nr:hypothetical protein [Nitrososphaerota archaeon]